MQGCGQGNQAAQPSSADVCGASSCHWTPGWSLITGEDDSEDVGRTWKLGFPDPGAFQWGMEVTGKLKSPVSDESQHRDLGPNDEMLGLPCVTFRTNPPPPTRTIFLHCCLLS